MIWIADRDDAQGPDIVKEEAGKSRRFVLVNAVKLSDVMVEGLMCQDRISECADMVSAGWIDVV